MNEEAARFYLERDRRSGQYVGDGGMPVGPVGLVVGADAAETVAGQLATLALVNMLARVHRTLVVKVPDVPLAVRSTLTVATDISQAVLGTAKAINPYIDVVEAGSLDGVPTLGIGVGVASGLDGYLVVDGWSGGVAGVPSAMGGGERSILGAGMASCLAAAFLFHRARGRHPGWHSVSLWHLAEAAGDPGPTISWPLDVGEVVVIGGGAVGSGVAYWLSQVGVLSPWTFVDLDVVRLHNTNRGLGMTAADAGWPGGIVGEEKATVAARLLGERGRGYVGSYRAWLTEHPEDRPDLVIPLANEDGIRVAVMARGEPVLIHGTTSHNWTAELHRHIPDVDDCIPCRLPDRVHARLACSEGPADPGDTAEFGDAALPFLSGTAALLVVAGLMQLQVGALAGQPRNHWCLHMELGHRLVTATRWSCGAGCTRILPREVRRRVRTGGRWDHLD